MWLVSVSEIHNGLPMQCLSHGDGSARHQDYFKKFDALRAIVICCIRLFDVKVGLNISIAGHEMDQRNSRIVSAV